MAHLSATTVVCVGSRGESDSWDAQQANVRRVFNTFVEHNVDSSKENNQQMQPVVTRPFEKLGEADLVRRELYAHFAGYLVDVYVQPKGSKSPGKPLNCTTAINYLNNTLHQAKERFAMSTRGETVAFFTCVDPKAQTESRKWLVGLRDNVFKRMFKRAAEAGEEMDHSALLAY